MSGRSAKNSNRGSDLFGYFVSGKYKEYHTNQYAGPPPESGLTATGGVISDYADGPTVYRAHIFTSSGTFEVESIGTLGDTVEYLVVAGGGGGGGTNGGGGGAGGLRTNVPGVVDAGASPLTGSPYPIPSASFPAPYTVTIGAGGQGAISPPHASGTAGGVSEFYPTPVSHPSPTRIRADGGGAGIHPAGTAVAGGSGGGGSGGPANSVSGPDDKGSGNTPPYSPPQGNPGGNGGTNNATYNSGGGGGGAGSAGSNGTNTAYPPNEGPAGPGGAGVQVAIAGPTATTFTGVGALNPGPGEYQWFAGGGGGGANLSQNSTGGSGGVGGGGTGRGTNSGTEGLTSTGGGGGGGAGDGSGNPYAGFNGGSGIVVVRYKIAQLTATQKATGGAISYYGGKTIHTFTGSGTFATTANWTSTDVEYVVVAGGAGGGGRPGYGSGGGGAGGYKTGTTPIGAHPVSTTIQVGAGGIGGLDAFPSQGSNGTPSYFGTPITSTGGGGGGYDHGPYSTLGNPGGSGGGNAGGPQTQGGPNAGIPGQGYSGGSGGPQPPNASTAAGGGGGAGGQGSDRSGSTGGAGGIGVQLPATFQNPTSRVGAPGSSGTYWVAGGGGGGGAYGTPNADGGGGGGGTVGTPYSGAGDGGGSSVSGNSKPNATSALENTGSGGGGKGGNGPGSVEPNDVLGGSGGSGIVLIAYPS